MVCVMCLVVPRRSYPSPLLSEFLGSSETLKSLHDFIISAVVFGKIFLKNAYNGVSSMTVRDYEVLFVLFKVFGLCKEKLEKVVHMA